MKSSSLNLLTELRFVAIIYTLAKYSVETIILHTLTGTYMKYLSNKMLSMLERLSEMFPSGTYQTRLDAYLSTKGITDAAQLEHYIQKFDSQKENYI